VLRGGKRARDGEDGRAKVVQHLKRREHL
jgi:hypothetical protein